LEKHHQTHKANDSHEIEKILRKVGLPAHICLLVGSDSIAQQTINQYLRRRPGDLDFYVESPEAWKHLQKYGTEVPGAIGNTVIQYKIDGVDVEFFQHLPNFPEWRKKGVFKRGVWENGVLCMSLSDITLWKYRLRQMAERKQSKKDADAKDALTAIRARARALFLGDVSAMGLRVISSMTSTGLYQDRSSPYKQH